MVLESRSSYPGPVNRLVGVLAALPLVTGCFGYNQSAKRWAYVGDSVLIAGGGAAIATDLLTRAQPCMEPPAIHCTYESPVTGAMVAGSMLVIAGVVGMIVNATRPVVKTSR